MLLPNPQPLPYRLLRDPKPFAPLTLSLWRGPSAGRTAGAGTLPESIEALDQSIWSARDKHSRKVRWSFSHTPASCQSRKRRQQVIPLPQPISGGSISHGMPVFSTKRIPVRTARLSKRGRPPLGLGCSGGRRGSTSFHSSSVIKGFAIPQLPIFGVLLGALRVYTL
jgi:hypothetical protein